jgi:electron transfer flavoprotein beta subunit
MKAKKKEIREIDITDLDIDEASATGAIEQLEIVPERSGAKMLQGSVVEQVEELIRILKEDEKVL